MLTTRPLLAFFCLSILAHAQSISSPDQIYSDPKVVHPPVPIRIAEADMPDQARRQQLDGLCILNGKPVPVRASVHLVCEGFEPPDVP